jgi:hypothetical protein
VSLQVPVRFEGRPWIHDHVNWSIFAAILACHARSRRRKSSREGNQGEGRERDENDGVADEKGGGDERRVSGEAGNGPEDHRSIPVIDG